MSTIRETFLPGIGHKLQIEASIGDRMACCRWSNRSLRSMFCSSPRSRRWWRRNQNVS